MSLWRVRDVLNEDWEDTRAYDGFDEEDAVLEWAKKENADEGYVVLSGPIDVEVMSEDAWQQMTQSELAAADCPHKRFSVWGEMEPVFRAREELCAV
jgi:hypothetical protein